MTHQNPPEHYQGKTVSEHLKEARLRGAKATSETHGTEMPGHVSAGADSAKNTAVFYLLLWAITTTLAFHSLLLFISTGIGLMIWHTGRSALLGWAHLERLHRLIEEERWEIEHHRDQEKEELREMYADKGFSGQILDTVVDTLMSDDNRLLKIMLEEELGLTLEAYEHPLKQASGAALGTFIASLLGILGFYFWPLFGIPITSFCIVIFTSHFTAKYEKRKSLYSIIWNFSLAFFAAFFAYFLTKLL